MTSAGIPSDGVTQPIERDPLLSLLYWMYTDETRSEADDDRT